MTGKRHDRRRTTQVVAYATDRVDATQAALAAARTAGCTCEPEILVHGIHVTIHHDHWCALLHAEDVN